MPDGRNGVLENLSTNVNVPWHLMASPQVERPATVYSEDQDLPASTGTPITLRLGDSATGNIAVRTDDDWYRVELTRGVSYAFVIRGQGAGGGTLVRPGIGLYTSTGSFASGFTTNITPEAITFYYTPTASGVYYVEANADGNINSGTYTLSFERTVPFGDDNPHTAATLAPNSQITSSIENGIDFDWYRITLMAGVRYTISLGGGTLYDPVLSIRDSAGEHITGDNDSGPLYDSLLTYTPTTTGVYYLVATTDHVFATGNFRGTYTLNITTTSTADDYASSAATTGALSAGGSASGVIERGNDADWFRISLSAGQTYRVDVQGALSDNGTILRPFVSVVTPTGVPIAEVPITSDVGDRQLTFTATNSGTYYVHVTGMNVGENGSYRVSFASQDDYGVTAATSGVVAINGAIVGGIGETGDVDWIRVSLTAGTVYQIDVRGAASGGGTLADPLISLLGATGTVLRSDNDSGAGADARILFTASASGDHYVAVRSAAAGQLGSYTIGVTANPDDYAASTATTGAVVAGGSATGIVETAGNRDWFRTDLTAGTTYAIELRGTAAGSGLRWTESSLILRSSLGGAIAIQTQTGLGAAARLVYTATATGTYYLDTLAYGTGVGSYAISVTPGAASAASATVADHGEPESAAEWSHIIAPPAADFLDVMREGAAPHASSSAPASDLFSALTAPPSESFFAAGNDEHRLNAALYGAFGTLTQAQPFNIF